MTGVAAADNDCTLVLAMRWFSCGVAGRVDETGTLEGGESFEIGNVGFTTVACGLNNMLFP
jgi:hypothetical protein